MDSRISIVGQNGTGKSTLLNLVEGKIQPVEGSVQRHAGLKLARYSQHSADQLPFDKSPIEYFESLFKEKVRPLRSLTPRRRADGDELG